MNAAQSFYSKGLRTGDGQRFTAPATLPGVAGLLKIHPDGTTSVASGFDPSEDQNITGDWTFTNPVNASVFRNGETGRTTIGNETEGVHIPGALTVDDSPQFQGLKLSNFNGLLKADSGVVSPAVAGTDYLTTYSNRAGAVLSEAFGTTAVVGNYSVAMGANASSSSFSVSIGYNASPGSSGVALGHEAISGYRSISIGRSAYSTASNSISLGHSSGSGSSSVSMGSSTSSRDSSVVIGSDAIGSSQTVICIGRGATSTEGNQLTFGSPAYPMTQVRFPGASQIEMLGNYSFASGVTSAGYNFKESDSDPTLTDVPNGFGVVWHNTSTGEVRNWIKVNGSTLKKSAPYT